MSHAQAEAVQVVLHAAAIDDVVRSVELYQGICGDADKFN